MSQLRFLGLGALLVTSSLAGLLLAGAPGLREVPAVQLGSGEDPTVIPVVLLLQIASLAVAAAAFFVRRARVLLYGYIIMATSWTLVGSTRFPWWLLQSADNPLRESPGAGVVFLIGLTLGALLLYLLVEALETYRRLAQDRGVPAELIQADLRRITANYLILCGIAEAIGLLLLSILDRFVADAGWVPELSGDAWGFWILLLIAFLLAGILLMLGRAKSEAAKSEEWKPIS